MAEILATPESLRERAKELRTDRQEHDQIIAKMTTLVNNLPTEYKGAAADAFIASFNSMKSTFENFSQLLENFATELEKNAQILEDADKLAADGNKSLGEI